MLDCDRGSDEGGATVHRGHCRDSSHHRTRARFVMLLRPKIADFDGLCRFVELAGESDQLPQPGPSEGEYTGLGCLQSTTFIITRHVHVSGKTCMFFSCSSGRAITTPTEFCKMALLSLILDLKLYIKT